MRWSLILSVACIVVGISDARADGQLDVGLLLNAPDVMQSDKNIPFNFSANVGDENYSVGLSARFGSVVLGFESVRSGSFDSGSGAGLSGDNAGLTSTSSVLDDTTHRMLLGVTLPNKAVVYGFNGVTNRSSRRSMSYRGFDEISVQRFLGYYCIDGKEVAKYDTISTDVISEGDAQYNFANLGLVLGAGFSHHVMGGMLRFEYSMTHFGASNYQLAINTSSSDESVSSSGSSFKNVQWDEQFEHNLELRWATEF